MTEMRRDRGCRHVEGMFRIRIPGRDMADELFFAAPTAGKRNHRHRDGNNQQTDADAVNRNV